MNHDISFNLLGTLLPPYEDDEAVQKPVHIQDQTVKDDRGRRRFHGAFTGGFSAGYYNTVGSEQGWEPSNFKSSRAKKAGSDLEQNPEMYMDAEDFNDYGIAPKTVGVNVDFSTTVAAPPPRKRAADNTPTTDTKNIVNIKCPIGEHLMAKLGWKRGHGLGELTEAERITESIEKVYGCSRFPPKQTPSTSEGLKFTSPRDICPIDFTTKENKHGIGYRGIDYNNAMITGGVSKASSERFSLFDDPMLTRPADNKRGITGQAFGTGAFETEDTDIYDTPDIHKYNRTIGGDTDATDARGKTKPKERGHMERLIDVLDGFSIGSVDMSKEKTVYSAPILPAGFVPVHDTNRGSTTDTKIIDVGTKMDANVRGLLIGEKPRTLNKGVFEVLNKEKRVRKSRFSDVADDKHSKFKLAPPPMKENDGGLKHRVFTDTPVTNNSPRKFTASKPATKIPVKLSYDLPILPPVTSKPLFLPFSSNRPKQERYDYFLFLSEIKKTDLYPDYISTLTVALTEWELGQEVREFTRAISIYRPLTGAMASRFTKAGFVDNSVEPVAPEVKKEVKPPVAYGKLTRTIIKWFPESLLCKRFNIANPHADSAKSNSSSGSTNQTTAPPPGDSGGGDGDKSNFSVFKFLDKTTIDTHVAQPLQKPNIVNPVTTTTPAAAQHLLARGDSAGPYDTRNVQMIQDPVEKPTMDMFKAIFENSDDDDEDDDEDISDEAEDEVGGGNSLVPASTNRIEVNPPVTINPPPYRQTDRVVIRDTMKEIIEESKADISFGPALPPAVSNIKSKKSKKKKSKHSKKEKKKKHNK